MQHLFSPIRIGKMEVKNRIVMPAMHMNYTMDGFVTEQLIEFYRKRAASDVGLIMIGGCRVDDRAGGQVLIGLDDDKFIEGLSNFTKAIHEEGGLCGTQLYHAGRYTYRFFMNGEPAWSASETMSGLTHEQSREMTKDDIKETVNNFAQAARRAKEAGFDMVEVIGSAGYLICQFLSPLTNKRTDEYGGSLENRMRFGLEVVGAVIEEVGKDYPVGVRIAGNDFVKDSNTNDENRAFAAECEKLGVAMFNVTGGWHESRVPQLTGNLPRGGFAYLARNVKQVVSKPVAASNRIRTPEMAERLLRDGWADMISLGRPLIADPDWVLKAEENRAKEIIPCISCNQRCLDNVFMMQPINCTMNPQAGHEAETLEAAGEKKKVLVAGGGPAGLMAAITAAERGHDVELWEKETVLGGQLWAASAAPNKEEFHEIIPAYEAKAKALGVRIVMSKEATKGNVKDYAPDTLVVATGSKPVQPPIETTDDAEILQAEDILNERAFAGEKVIVIGGGATGVETASFLAEIGTLPAEVAAFLLKHDGEKPEVIRELLWKGNKDVTLIELLPKIGKGIGKSTKWVALKEVQELGVKVFTEASVKRITAEGVVIESSEGERLLEADSVVMAAGVKAYNPLEGIEEDLPDGAEVVVIGDAKGVSNAADAIYQGYKQMSKR